MPEGGRAAREAATGALPALKDPGIGGQYNNKNPGKRGLSLNVADPRGLDIAKPRCHVIARSERGAAPWRRVMQHDHDFDDLLCFRGHA